MKYSVENPPSVSEVIEFPQTQTREVFPTKSGGKLSVAFALPFELMRDFTLYDVEELKRVPKDIRGLRNYEVRDLPNGQIGGTEFHRIRQEIVMGVAGQVRWICEDLYGNKKEYILTPANGVYMPPFILHTYIVEENGSGLMVVCNTLFSLPANPSTNDTYSIEEFQKFQSHARDSMKK